MKLNPYLIVLLFLLPASLVFSQGVAVNESGSSADANAILDISSATKGVLISRMTASERETLGAQTPTEGMLVYDTDSSAFYYYHSGWVRLAGGAINETTNSVVLSEPLLLTGDAVVFEDFRVPATAAKAGGSGVPPNTQVSALGNIYEPFFQDVGLANEQSLYFNIQLPHSWKEGTTLYPHVHWMPSSTGAGTVRWGFEYTWVNIDGTFGTTTTIFGEEATTGVAYQHLMTALNSASMPGTGKTASSMILCRIFRNSSHDNDTFTGDAIMLEFDLHYQVDKLGDVYVP